jgi:uncharacterized protein YndB with AHSA1/START domain
MEGKTKIHAEDGKQDLVITREFELPVDLLFRAYIEPEIVEQWMGTKVLKMANEQHGGYQFETTDPKGNIVFRANGVIHSFVANKQIIRTFEMENSSFPVQLEYLDFDAITEERSKLSMQIVYRSVEHRNQMLKLPFAQGLNMAHNRLQEILNNLK